MLLSNTALHVKVRKRHFQQWACMCMGLNPILKQADENEEGIQLPNVSGVILNALGYVCIRSSQNPRGALLQCSRLRVHTTLVSYFFSLDYL